MAEERMREGKGEGVGAPPGGREEIVWGQREKRGVPTQSLRAPYCAVWLGRFPK